MMYIFMLDSTNEVIGQYAMCKPDPAGYRVEENTVLAIPDLHYAQVESVPDDFSPYKYCYTVDKEFYVNPNYQEPQPGIEEQIATLKSTVADNKKTYEAKITALTEQNDFLEDCIAEMASVVYADDSETA